MTTSTIRTCPQCGTMFQRERGKICFDCLRSRIPEKVAYLGKPLTNRQMQIAVLVAAGHPNKEIAWQLRLSQGTVKVYMAQIFIKLGLSNRVQLARWALTGGDPPKVSTFPDVENDGAVVGLVRDHDIDRLVG